MAKECKGCVYYRSTNYTNYNYACLYMHDTGPVSYTHLDVYKRQDHSGADWNEQALKKAHSYLDYSAFSYQGLIEQLEFEEFTTEQATYAVDNCGANWNEQAVKKAESYLSFSSFSREELISQLEFEKFTHEQAVYLSLIHI